jgi:integrase
MTKSKDKTEKLALTQFYIAGRIQEAAGLTVECVDMEKKGIEISKVIVWSRTTKEFDYLKESTKTGAVRHCYINETLYEILDRNIKSLPDGCKFVFNLNGEPLKIRVIQSNYNKALRKAGLFPKYSGTHILRHSMAAITREVTGSLDSTQAVTGHQDRKMVQHYSGSPSYRQKDAVIEVEKVMMQEISKYD